MGYEEQVREYQKLKMNLPEIKNNLKSRVKEAQRNRQRLLEREYNEQLINLDKSLAKIKISLAKLSAKTDQKVEGPTRVPEQDYRLEFTGYTSYYQCDGYVTEPNREPMYENTPCTVFLVKRNGEKCKLLVLLRTNHDVYENDPDNQYIWYSIAWGCRFTEFGSTGLVHRETNKICWESCNQQLKLVDRHGREITAELESIKREYMGPNMLRK